ncbi:MAG TPA: zinc-binding dehydrogenase [Phycisphaerales bacterium]|nr:zinc-binding dehydrogenase [Phycisphaerales bacterium]
MTTLQARPAAHAGATTTMRVGVITGPGTFEVREQPIPQPGKGQVRVRLEGCGVCGSNIPAWEGRPWFRYPLEPGKPGHEGWGVIDALGEGVTDLHKGQRVGVLSYAAFAEYDVADAPNVVPLPAGLDGVPMPAEALGCAMNVFRRSGIEAHHTVAIVGYGFMGALIAQLAGTAGARVIAISRRESALALARQQGVPETVALTDNGQVIERVKSLTGGTLCDVVVEAAGVQQALDLSTELTKERGRLIIAGFHQDGPRTVNMFLWNWRGLDVINAHERDPKVYVEGMRLAIDEVAAGRMDPAPLCTHAFPLERLGDALSAAKDRPDGFLKAIVRP